MLYEVITTFYQRPVANAGLDDAVCGNDYELGAVYDLSESAGYTPSGIWSVYNAPSGESADILTPQSDTTLVSVSEVGIWNFIFRENRITSYNVCYTKLLRFVVKSRKWKVLTEALMAHGCLTV